MEQQSNRAHRPVKEKKKYEGNNPKAFAFSKTGKLNRQAARSHDVKEKRLHVPQVDRMPEEAPPTVIAVVGPPGVGKTTLIKSLIRRYTKQTLSSPQGPLTIVTSKKQRLTFLECPSDSLAAMIDVSKIADIVLLMIDGNYGFEMETMEFLNALSTSGMPGNVFGILTHLDLFKKQSTLKMTKKRLKHRFWSELYQGAKLFYLSGVINGRYPDREVHNLSRFLSVMKTPRPLMWRNSHPYALADRFLDITPPTKIEENPKCDRTVALYGYLRGTNFPAQGARVHVPGVGDLTVSGIEGLPDPRKLGEKQKLLFAPMSDVGGVLVDKDAVTRIRGLGEQLVVGLQSERRLLGEADQGVRLFRGGEAITKAGEDEGTDEEASDDDDDEVDFEENENDEDEGMKSMCRHPQTSRIASKNARVETLDAEEDDELESGDEDEEDEEEEEDEEGNLRWKENMLASAKALHGKRPAFRVNDLSRMMYDESITPVDVVQIWRGENNGEEGGSRFEADEEADDFFKKTNNEKNDEADLRAIPEYDYDELERKWRDEELIESLKLRFITGKLSALVAQMMTMLTRTIWTTSIHDDEGDGAFEDLESGEVFDGFKDGDEGDDEDEDEDDGARGPCGLGS
ncbi:Ribosome biogenesis protein bms1 [Penicillium sp. IBT 18751x]|nr:Ribosome biogenesis protein bms1 [Penicillium sp. IBT 18751x]